MDVRLITLVESRIRGNMYVRFGGGFLETCYSDIVRRGVSILRLRAQYIWYFGGMVVILLIIFAVLYIAGINTYICIALIGGTATAGSFKIFALSHQHGEHGLMKAIAKKRVPKVLKSYTRRNFQNLTIQEVKP